MLVGAYFWGAVSDSYGRKKGMLGGTVVTAAAGLLSAFAPNYVSLLILRCTAGFGLGGGNVFMSWFLEFVPTSNRGAWMIVFSSFWTVGTIFEAALAWIIMPSFGWRWLVALSSGPSFITLILYGLAPESPRFLCINERVDEAHDILEKAARLNGTILQTGKLVCDHKMHDDSYEFAASENIPLLSPKIEKHCGNNNTNSSLLVILFSTKLIRTNILLWFLFFANTFSYYGIILLTSELSSDQTMCTKITLHSVKSQNASIYIDVFVTSLAEVPGLILSAFIVDRVGRKLSMVIMLALGSLLLLPLCTHQNQFWTMTLLFGARAFVSASFNVAYIYAPEVYPTKIRTTRVGITSAVGRIGGMVCPLVAAGLVDDCQQAYAVILFEVMIILSAFSVLLIPFETKGRNLVDNVVTNELH